MQMCLSSRRASKTSGFISNTRRVRGIYILVYICVLVCVRVCSCVCVCVCLQACVCARAWEGACVYVCSYFVYLRLCVCHVCACFLFRSEFPPICTCVSVLVYLRLLSAAACLIFSVSQLNLWDMLWRYFDIIMLVCSFCFVGVGGWVVWVYTCIKMSFYYHSCILVVWGLLLLVYVASSY